jgi:hypothetical protein
MRPLPALALLLTAAPLAAAEERWRCALFPDAGAEVALAFVFDPAQLAPALSPNDPPRRAEATVTLNGRAFAAEPFAMADGTVGFHTEAGAPQQRMLVVAPDGAARYSDSAAGLALAGRCARAR